VGFVLRLIAQPKGEQSSVAEFHYCDAAAVEAIDVDRMTGARSGHSPFRRVSVPDTGQYCAVFETYFLGRLMPNFEWSISANSSPILLAWIARQRANASRRWLISPLASFSCLRQCEGVLHF
jgi:hypothetical protein